MKNSAPLGKQRIKGLGGPGVRSRVAIELTGTIKEYPGV
jgi:hypothetical protein